MCTILLAWLYSLYTKITTDKKYRKLSIPGDIIVAMLIIILAIILACRQKNSSTDLSARIFFTTFGGGIQVLSLSNSQVKTVINSTEQFNGVAVDAVNEQIYYSTWDGKVYRAKEDGTEISTVIEASDYISGLAVDLKIGHLYGDSKGNVFRCKTAQTDSLNCTTLLSDKNSIYDGISVTPNERAMYLTTRAPSGQIVKAGIDGSNPVVLVGNLDDPSGIFVDNDSSRVLWTDYNADKIQSSYLNGTDVRDIIQLPRGSEPIGTVVYRERIYWANWATVQSCNRAGQDVQTLYTATDIICQMALVT